MNGKLVFLPLISEGSFVIREIVWGPRLSHFNVKQTSIATVESGEDFKVCLMSYETMNS
jgi:hypothetical protein